MDFSFCNDQPGRLIAVFLIAPILFLKGINYDDLFIFCFAIILFLWDLYYIIFTKPNCNIY
jgi:hypothetical protein